MKKVFGFFIGFALVMAATLFTSCAQSYTGKYYDVTYVPEVTQDEIENYKKQTSYKAALDIFLELKNSKSGSETKTNLKDTELINYLVGNNISKEDAQNHLNILNNALKGSTSASTLSSFSYKVGEETFYALCLSEAKN